MEGLEIATDIIPDLIITDVMMPLMDGFALCLKLRSDERTSHIPIIILTAKTDLISNMEGPERGANEYWKNHLTGKNYCSAKKLLELRKQLHRYYLKKAGLTDNPFSMPAPIDDKIEDTFVRKVRESVEAHLADFNFTVEQLCKYVFLSHSQLHRKLEVLAGCNPINLYALSALIKQNSCLRTLTTALLQLPLNVALTTLRIFHVCLNRRLA